MRVFTFILPLLLFLTLPVIAQERVPVIFDTDIGDDIDDTWALGLILASGELDLKLVVTDYGDTRGKAQIAAKFLETVGRSDIPVGIGVRTSDKPGRQHAWAADYDLDSYPGAIHEDGVGAIINTVASATQPVTYIVVGPCPNVPELLRRAPGIVSRVNVVAMSGSIDRGYQGTHAPDAEYNVRADIDAAKALYSAGWPLTIAPLDTAALVRLRGTPYIEMLRLSRNPTAPNILVQTIMENYQLWVKEGNARLDTQVSTSILFDTVAVYLAIEQAKVEMQDLRLKVDDRGYTVRDPNGKWVSAAMNWKIDPQDAKNGFHMWMAARLTQGVFHPKAEETINPLLRALDAAR